MSGRGDPTAAASARVALASTSPRRRELLGHLGVPFAVVATSVDETSRPNESPFDTAARLSAAKAIEGAGKLSLAGVPVEDCPFVIGADTIVVDENRSIGKPANGSDAAAMLGRLRGRAHEVITAVTLLDRSTCQCVTRGRTTKVHLRQLNDHEIASYVATGDPLDKAGGYAIQNERFHLVDWIEGCYSNVVGLPLCLLAELLNARRVKVRTEWLDDGVLCRCARLCAA